MSSMYVLISSWVDLRSTSLRYSGVEEGVKVG